MAKPMLHRTPRSIGDGQTHRDKGGPGRRCLDFAERILVALQRAARGAAVDAADRRGVAHGGRIGHLGGERGPHRQAEASFSGVVAAQAGSSNASTAAIDRRI